MTQVRIVNPFSENFSMVPNCLWQLGISIQAKAIFAYGLSFRDGHVLRAARIEEELGIGRDARRRAMRELADIGLCRYEVGKDASGRITTKELLFDATPLMRLQAEKTLGPDIQAVGEIHHGPEKPAVGFSGPVGVDIRPSRGGVSGPFNKTKKKTGAVRLKKAAAPKPQKQARPIEGQPDLLPDVALCDLTKFQQSRLREGKSLPVDGRFLNPDAPQYRALVRAMRAECLN